jgi:hypothetical protein
LPSSSDAKLKHYRFLRPLGLCLLLLCLIVALNGCGKTGYPVPPDRSRSFAWERTNAEPAGPCIAFTGSFSGAHKHFNGIRLELQALRSIDDCVGCPFTPDEVVELSPREAGFNPDDGSVAFSYCPKKSAPVYRWSMAGISEYSRMPHAVMVGDRLLVLTP